MRILLILAFSLWVSGCATITRGTNQTVAVNTPGVPQATCILTSSAVGSRTVVTPGTVSLEKSKETVSVRCIKECYSDGAGVIPTNFEGMTAGNIVLGGVIGLGVDAASGAMNNYAPEVQVLMTPIAGCGRPSERERGRRPNREPVEDRSAINPITGKPI